MTEFDAGDHVSFIGDPDEVTLEVTYVNSDGSLDVSDGRREWEFIPARLFHEATPDINVGSVWQSKSSQERLFVVDLVESANLYEPSNLYKVVVTGISQIVTMTRRDVVEAYELVHDG